MRLGALWGQLQAQLDGFKSRVLRAEAPAQRHLYTIEWHGIEVAGGVSAKALVISNNEAVDCEHLWSHGSHAESMTALHSGEWTGIAVAVATQRGPLGVAALSALDSALALVQAQLTTMPTGKLWLLTTGVRITQGYGAFYAL